LSRKSVSIKEFARNFGDYRRYNASLICVIWYALNSLKNWHIKNIVAPTSQQ